MRYKFSMENILELREGQEQKEMEVMAKIQNELKVAIEDKKNLENLKIQTIEEKKCFKDFQELMYLDMYLLSLEENIEESDIKVKSIKEKLNTQRQKLVKAQKDRKIIEKLKQKDKEKFISEIQRVEQNELDEIAVLKYNNPSTFRD